MMEAFKNQLLTNWHTMRWVALGMGLFLGINWLMNSAPISGFLSMFFLYQAITNTGCLAGQCTPVYEKVVEDDRSEFTDYKEIK